VSETAAGRPRDALRPAAVARVRYGTETVGLVLPL
jgi:hypothetical protein